MRDYLKYFNIFDVAFYKFYRFAKLIHVDGAKTTAGALLCILIILPISGWMARQKDYTLFMNLKRWQLFIIFGVITFLLSIYFLYNKRHQIIIKKYENESRQSKIVTDILFILLLVLYFIFLL